MKLEAAGQMTMSSARRLSVLSLAIGSIALAGCGSSSKSTSSSTAQATSTPSSAASSTPATAPAASAGRLSLAANPEGQLKYNTNSLSAKAGKVTIVFTNQAPLAHNVTVAAASGAVVGTTPTFQGGSKALALDLKPGTYKFYCTVPGHRAAGMEGTLTVQ